MPENGRRQVVSNPLEQRNLNQAPQATNLPIAPVRNPRLSGGSGNPGAEFADAFGKVSNSIGNYIDSKKEEWMDQGRTAYMTGAAEADLMKNGNRFVQQGYLQLQTKDAMSNWYMEQAAAIDEGYDEMDPQEYQAFIADQRKRFIDSIEDPYAKKIAVAGFAEFNPKLAQSQFVKNNEFNRQQRITGFQDMLGSSSHTNITRSVVDGQTALRLSASPVIPVVKSSAYDRDIAIKTMLGEAYGEGDTGLAAVAHVLRNRASDKRWPDTLAGVSLQNKQFSTWNKGAGGNNPGKWKPGSAAYEKAGRVYDAVMSGRHVDPTNGATHYYSPKGMQKLVRDGSQKNLLPKWLQAEAKRSGGQINIGGHIFVGKATGTGDRPAVEHPQLAEVPDDIQQLQEIAAAEGTASGISSDGASNQLQEIIRQYGGLNSEDKSTALSQSMVLQLEAGDDTLFNDAGGVGILREIGATAEQVARVERAHRKFQQDQANKFSAENELWENDLTKRIADGLPLDQALSEIESRAASQSLSDQGARSLAGRAATLARKAEANAADDAASALESSPEVLQATGALYQGIKAGDIGLDEAQGFLKDFQDRWGLSKEYLQDQMVKMAGMEQGYKDGLRRKAEQAAVKRQKQVNAIASVQHALSNGGVANLTGSITTTNDQGQEIKVSTKDYAIQQIKENTAQSVLSKMQPGEDGQLSPEDQAMATEKVFRNTMLQLQKHGVTDKQTAEQFRAAMTGDLLTPEGGLRSDAEQAYHMYSLMRDTGDISPGFIAEQIPDAEARDLLETAYQLSGGEMGADALIKAQRYLNDPLKTDLDPQALSIEWQRKMTRMVDGDRRNIAQRIFFEDTELNPKGNFAEGTYNFERASTYTHQLAQMHHMRNPRLSVETAYRLAEQDAVKNSKVILGNMVIDPDHNIVNDMGLNSFGEQAADAAFSWYLSEYGADVFQHTVNDNIWEVFKSDPRGLFTNNRNAWTRYGAEAVEGYNWHGLWLQDRSPVHVEYNRSSGTLMIDLYTNKQDQTLLGAPVYLDVAEVGRLYREHMREPSMMQKAFDNLFEGIGEFGRNSGDIEIPQRRGPNATGLGNE